MPPSKCQTFQVFRQSRPVAAGCEQRDDLIATLASQSVNSDVDSAQRCLLSTTTCASGGVSRDAVGRAIGAVPVGVANYDGDRVDTCVAADLRPCSPPSACPILAC